MKIVADENIYIFFFSKFYIVVLLHKNKISGKEKSYLNQLW